MQIKAVVIYRFYIENKEKRGEVQVMEKRFDPMTGEPITGEGKADESSSADAQATAEETLQNVENVASEETLETPVNNSEAINVTGEGDAPKKDGKKVAIIVIIGIIFLVALIASAFVVIRQKALGKNHKIIDAAYNTVKDEPLITTFSDVKFDPFKITLALSGEGEGVSADLTTALDMTSSDMSITGTVGYDSMTFNVAAYMDDTELLFSVPEFTDKTLVYNYVDAKTGYITEITDSSNLDELDKSLQSIFGTPVNADDYDSVKSVEEELLNISKDNFNELDFEKVDAKDCTVNEESVKCKGYVTTLTKENVDNWITDCREAFANSNSSDNSSWEDVFSTIEDHEDEIDGTEVSFYLYKNQIAEIDVVSQEATVIIEFQGGATPTENIVVTRDDEEIFSKKGTTDGTTETSVYTFDGTDSYTLAYNTESGDMEVKSADDAYTPFAMSGNLAVTADSVTFEISSLSYDGEDMDFSGKAVLSSGADVSVMEASDDAFDISSATEDDWMDLLMEIQTVMYNMMY